MVGELDNNCALVVDPHNAVDKLADVCRCMKIYDSSPVQFSAKFQPDDDPFNILSTICTISKISIILSLFKSPASDSDSFNVIVPKILPMTKITS